MNRLKEFLFTSSMALTLCAMVGCQQAQPPAAPQATTVVAQPVQKDALASWIANAPAPQTVTSSVNRDVAPTAVDRFNAISEQVSALYSAVYTEAQEAATARATGDVMADTVLAKAAEGVATTPGTSWKTVAQETVIASYQATAKAIAAQGDSIAAYTESLKTDASIVNLPNQMEKTAVLMQIGKDTAALSRQLKTAGEGASAIRMRRISTALGK